MGRVQKGNFGEGSVTGHIVRLALPVMAAEIVHVLYNIVDRIFIGHLPDVGTAALTGVGIAFPLITLVGAFANFATTGGATICSIYRGEGDNAKAQRVIETSLTFSIIVGGILTIIFVLFSPQLLSFMGGDEETLPYALSYFKIYSLGCIPVLISLGMNSFITAQGFATTGMLTVIIGAVLNIILDPLLMFTFDMGIAGAAIATVISQFVSAIWILLFFLSKKPIVPVRRLLIDGPILKKILKLGITGFIFKSTTSLTQAAVNMTLKEFGGAMSTVYVGAMSIINSIREIASIPVNGISNGYSPVASFNYGAKKWDRLDKSIGVGTVFALVMSGALWAFLMLFPKPLVSLFSEDAELVNLTITALRVYFSCFVFMGLQVLGQNTFVGLNYPKEAIFFSMLRKIIIVLPLTLILPRVGMGAMGVFWAEAISNVAGSVAAFSAMYFIIWRKVKQNAKGANIEI